MQSSSAAPPHEQSVLRYALERHALERPDAVYAAFEDEADWTFRCTLDKVRSTANGLAALNVGRGDTVLLMLGNSGFALRVMFALHYLGAIAVPVNTAYLGSLLRHVVENAGARLAVVEPELLPRLEEAAGPALATIVVNGTDVQAQPVAQTAAQSAGRSIHPASVLTTPAPTPLPDPLLAPWDTQFIIYTSGTTGASKGVLASYRHSYTAVGPVGWPCVLQQDRQLLHLPIFHIGGAFIASAALCRGSSIGVTANFSTERFWDSIRRLQVTSVFLLGVMASFLLKQAPRPDDRSHPLRMVFIVPLGAIGSEFAARFGVEVHTLFNMTEISTPLICGPNPSKPHVCGRPRPGVQLRLVDENDIEVPPGATGELVIRTDQPWAMNHGYHRDDAATARAWRNGWFHTGDCFAIDADGDYLFKDRIKDCIRRRGENISSHEVEAEVLTFPTVREVAAIPAPSKFGEDEVMLVVATIDSQQLDPAALFAHLQARLPHFMLPRYLRVLPALPKTPTAKVLKHLLREQGVTPDTLDLHQLGLRAKRLSS